ncbi:MerR family transcriptional regulator [Actinomadura nitritigenes]|jgi:DNA-binding transcriptional MerR regulator|uniref:MerR family transcriptional regulator n=1 Tax=Actinomadura nitritigenes TaxID=134602 RepID=UPI0036986CD7
MRIGELARRTGVDEQLLRYYEKQGLLTPERSPNGYRDYAEADVGAVRKIRALLAAGLSTATIAQVGSCLRDDSLPTPACAGVIGRLRAERARLDQAIGGLLEARAALDDVIDRGEGHEVPHGGLSTGKPSWASAPTRLR